MRPYGYNSFLSQNPDLGPCAEEIGNVGELLVANSSPPLHVHLLSTAVTRLVHEVLGVVLFSHGHLQSEAGVSTKQPLLWLHVSWVWGPWPGWREEPRAACPGGALWLGGAFNKSCGVFALFPLWEKENGRSTYFQLAEGVRVDRHGVGGGT